MTASGFYINPDLFVRIANGDEAAFRQVFELMAPQLKAYFIKLAKNEETSRELVQETFLNLWVYRNRLADVDQPRAYIYRIASNVSVAYFRKMGIERNLLASLANTDLPAPDETYSHLDLKDIRQAVEEAVSRLPPQQQQVFRLSREQGLSRAEIAAQLGLAEKTVRNHLTLSLKAVQEYLKNHQGVYLPGVLLIADLMY